MKNWPVCVRSCVHVHRSCVVQAGELGFRIILIHLHQAGTGKAKQEVIVVPLSSFLPKDWSKKNLICFQSRFKQHLSVDEKYATANMDYIQNQCSPEDIFSDHIW